MPKIRLTRGGGRRAAEMQLEDLFSHSQHSAPCLWRCHEHGAGQTDCGFRLVGPRYSMRSGRSAPLSAMSGDATYFHGPCSRMYLSDRPDSVQYAIHRRHYLTRCSSLTSAVLPSGNLHAPTMSQTQTEAPVTTTVRLEPRLEFRPLHETFGAECRGVDFSKPVPSDVMGVIREQLGKYGVLVFRNTGLSDEQYIKLADEFGELADSPPVRRFDGPRGLGDPSNIYLDGSIVVHGDLKWFMAKET